MVYIKFTKKSLLYGESCHWLVFVIFAPFYLWPNIKDTKTKNVLTDLAITKSLLPLFVRLSTSRGFQLFIFKLIILTQMSCLLIMIIITVAVNKEFVRIFSHTQEKELSYKVLYYGPILYRIGLLVLTGLILKDPNYKRWQDYDRANIFAIEEKKQFKIMLNCCSAATLDGLINFFEVLILLYYLQSDRYNWLKFDSMAKGIMFFVTLSWINSANILIRYKPLLDTMYSAHCVASHLRFIKNQLLMSGQNFMDPIETTDNHDALNQERQLEPNHLPDYKQLSSDSKLESWTTNGPSDRQKKSFKTRETNEKIENSSYDFQFFSSFDSEIDQGDDYIITNVYQLERHITQLDLFVSNIDSDAPSAVISILLLNLLAFISTFFYVKDSPKNVAILAFIFLLSRLMPMVALCKSGSAVINESKGLIGVLEVIYLQDPTQCLLYKHVGCTQLSLERIFKSLNSIKFSCGGLMDVDYGTLTRLMFYMATAILIVIQYDAIVWRENNVAGIAPSSNNIS